MRAHEVGSPVTSLVIVRFLLASLLLLGLHMEIILSPEWIRRHVVISSIPVVELSFHWHHTSMIWTSSELLIPFIRLRVVVPSGSTAPRSDPYLVVGTLSCFLFSPLVSVFVIFDYV